MIDELNGPSGPIGPKGMPGPFCARTEMELVAHLIVDLEKADHCGEQFSCEDGYNPQTAIDTFALRQALGALKNYEALLQQPLYQLVAPGFFTVERPAKTIQCVR